MKHTLLDTEYDKALAEIGTIQPWWSEADQLYGFKSDYYPFVDYFAKSPESVIKNYKRLLKEFILERLNGNMADLYEAIPGQAGRNWGGSRPGTGRPKAAEKTKLYRLPVSVGDWLKARTENIEKLKQMIEMLNEA
jgi:hypothetical protein